MSDRYPAYEHCPSAGEIAEWFLAEKRHESNVGGDAWWLSRNPHSSCWKLAFVDYDTQEFYLLEVTTEGSTDLLFVMAGLGGRGVDWWQHPTTDPGVEWRMDGVKWLAEQVEVHYDYQAMRAKEGLT